MTRFNKAHVAALGTVFSMLAGYIMAGEPIDAAELKDAIGVLGQAAVMWFLVYVVPNRP